MGVVIEIITLHTLKNIKNTFLAVLLTKLFVLIINLVKQLFFTGEKMPILDLLKQFSKDMIIAKTITKKFFNENLVLSEKDEQRLHNLVFIDSIKFMNSTLYALAKNL